MNPFHLVTVFLLLRRKIPPRLPTFGTKIEVVPVSGAFGCCGRRRRWNWDTCHRYDLAKQEADECKSVGIHRGDEGNGFQAKSTAKEIFFECYEWPLGYGTITLDVSSPLIQFCVHFPKLPDSLIVAWSRSLLVDA